jgi:CRP-like cAMP-binding protein
MAQTAKIFEKLVRQFPTGAAIFREGDFGDAMYIVQSGEAEVRKKAGDHEKLLYHLNPGDFFGEMALIDRSPRSATVIATTPLVLLEVTMRSFEFMLEKNLDFTKRLVRELVDKIRSSNELITELLTQNKRHRVAGALVSFSRARAKYAPQGNLVRLAEFVPWVCSSTGIERAQVLEILNSFIRSGYAGHERIGDEGFLVIPHNRAPEGYSARDANP